MAFFFVIIITWFIRFCRERPVKILTLFLVGVGPVRGPTSCHERGQGVVGWGLSPGGCFPRWFSLGRHALEFAIINKLCIPCSSSLLIHVMEYLCALILFYSHFKLLFFFFHILLNAGMQVYLTVFVTMDLDSWKLQVWKCAVLSWFCSISSKNLNIKSELPVVMNTIVILLYNRSLWLL